jgi:MurNAc alpha-1-phosphate uridylyltransferase
MSTQQAMILAAGHGSRMQPLTDHCPKPLLQAGKYRLIEPLLFALANAGIHYCVINTHKHPALFHDYLGDGDRYGLRIQYSHEPELLGTGGGMIQALDFLQSAPFLVVSGDIVTDYPFEKLVSMNLQSDAHLVMVDNPEQHTQGDFHLDSQGLLNLNGDKLSYSSIGLFHPRLFSGYPKGIRSIGEILKPAMLEKKITGEYFTGLRISVDTPDRLLVAKALINYQNPGDF